MSKQKITREALFKIFKDTNSKWEGDNALQGLNILYKYADHDVLLGAEHELIYSIGINEAIRNGLTKKDAGRLAELNWSIGDDNDYFHCFV